MSQISPSLPYNVLYNWANNSPLLRSLALLRLLVSRLVHCIVRLPFLRSYVAVPQLFDPYDTTPLAESVLRDHRLKELR